MVLRERLRLTFVSRLSSSQLLDCPRQLPIAHLHDFALNLHSKTGFFETTSRMNKQSNSNGTGGCEKSHRHTLCFVWILEDGIRCAKCRPDISTTRGRGHKCLRLWILFISTRFRSPAHLQNNVYSIYTSSLIASKVIALWLIQIYSNLCVDFSARVTFIICWNCNNLYWN